MIPIEKYGPREQDFLEKHEDFLFKLDIIALVSIIVLAIAMIF